MIKKLIFYGDLICIHLSLLYLLKKHLPNKKDKHKNHITNQLWHSSMSNQCEIYTYFKKNYTYFQQKTFKQRS